jgi:16S rRNA G1207 methylase RsmC
MPKTLMQSVVTQLQKERTRLEDELHRVTAALTAFGKVYLRGKKRTISAAGRKRIAAAQRARWARIRAAKK